MGIVETISKYVKLEKSGKNYIGLCPFHEEKTPSFTVSEEKKSFKCYGCDIFGNERDFIHVIEHMKSKEERAKLMIKTTKTHRGFDLIQFKDYYDADCSIQKSSLADDVAIWFGIDDANPIIMASKTVEGGTGWVKYPIHEDVCLTTRMHLNIDQVKELIPILQKFVDTGEIT
jgi:hypothetical protein